MMRKRHFVQADAMDNELLTAAGLLPLIFICCFFSRLFITGKTGPFFYGSAHKYFIAGPVGNIRKEPKNSPKPRFVLNFRPYCGYF